MIGDTLESFMVCDNKGVTFTFPNGYHVAMSWGPYDACSNRATRANPRMPKQFECYTCNDAEVVVWHDAINDGAPLTLDNGKTTHTHCTVERALMYLILYATLEKPNERHTRQAACVTSHCC